MSFVIGGGSTVVNQYGTLAATGLVDALQKLVAFLDSSNFYAATAAVGAGGSNYTVGDTLTIDGGSVLLGMRASVRVTSEAAGVVTGVEMASMGCYSATPAASGVATSHGQVFNPLASGLTVDLTAGSNGYTIERDDLISGGPEREMIVNAEGLDGLQEIYWGMQTHRDVPQDYYNVKLLGMTGYNAGLDFLQQPGVLDVRGSRPTVDYPLWDSDLPFWFYVNNQRVWLQFRPASIYIGGYAGLGVPFGPPTSYPYPLVWSGHHGGPDRVTPIRYSLANSGNANITRPPQGAAFTRWVDGSIYEHAFSGETGGSIIGGNIKCYPHQSFGGSMGTLQGLQITSDDILDVLRDTNGEYPLFPIVPFDGGVGQDFFNSPMLQLDRVYAVPGFALSSEDTVTKDGVKHRVFQDAYRTGRRDFIAVEET